jgi:hypothetical protein
VQGWLNDRGDPCPRNRNRGLTEALMRKPAAAVVSVAWGVALGGTFAGLLPYLLNNLWNRLQDEALLDRDDLTESLSQMNAGNVRPALTFDEERKDRRNRL